MSLFVQCKAARFFDEFTTESVESETRMLLRGFFEAVNATRVRSGDTHYSIQEAAEHFATTLARDPVSASREIPAAGLPNDRSVLSGGGRVSSGIPFGIDDHKNPRSRWNLFLHRTVVPLLELWTFHGYGFNRGHDWANRLVANETAHVIWLDGRFGLGFQKYFCREDHLYLWGKWQNLGFLSRSAFAPERFEAA